MVTCSRCNRQFGSKEALEQHSSASHTTPNHSCRECNRLFPSTEALDQHKSAAHRLPTVPCRHSSCNRLFHSREASDQHSSDSHRTPHPCQNCNRKFDSADALNDHIKAAHPRYPCQECNKLLASQDALNNHVQAAHPKYPCQECKSILTSQLALFNHTQAFHPRYPCSECNKILTSQESLNQHRLTKHPVITPIHRYTSPAIYQSPVRIPQGSFGVPSTSNFQSAAANYIPSGPALQTNPVRIGVTTYNSDNMTHQQSTSIPVTLPNRDPVEERLPRRSVITDPPNETELKVYPNLTELLSQKALKDFEVGWMNREKTPLDDLRTQISKVREAKDTVLILVDSSRYRNDLMKVSSALGCHDDQDIRQALVKDEAIIADLLRNTVNSVEEKTKVVALQEEQAENFLNLIQNILTRDNSLSRDPVSRQAAHRLQVKLSQTCGILPPLLSITDVKDCENEPVSWGGFADIYRASYKGKYVALKRLREFQDTNAGCQWQARRQFCREALVWQDLKHPNVLPFYGIDASTFPPRVCMVSPWMENGTVLKYIEKMGGPLMANIDRFLYEIALGLSFLHSKKVVHGDLRGSNILIDDDGRVLLADFGLTRFEDATLANQTSNRDGSQRWMAPELLYPNMFEIERFQRTANSDVYAFACVCLEIHTLKPAFPNFSEHTIAYKVLAGERPGRPTDDGEKSMSDELWALVKDCWKDIRQGRPSMVQVIKQIEEMRACV